jgi:hypothetical protein
VTWLKSNKNPKMKRNLISIDSSNQLAYNSAAKYIRFFNFCATHKKLNAWKNVLIFFKREKHPLKLKDPEWNLHRQIQWIREPYLSFELPSEKMWSFVFFERRKITDACLFLLVFLLLFFHGLLHLKSDRHYF